MEHIRSAGRRVKRGRGRKVEQGDCGRSSKMAEKKSGHRRRRKMMGGLASKKRTEKSGKHLVKELGVRSQRVNDGLRRYESAGGYRMIRCSQRFGCEPGRGSQSNGDKPAQV
jgi:hypothetical protein